MLWRARYATLTVNLEEEALMKEPLFAEFPFDEYELRVTRARVLMEEEGIDALRLVGRRGFLSKKTWSR